MSKSNQWAVGDKVLCVHTHRQMGVVKGQEYTIEGFSCCPQCGHPCLFLEEVKIYSGSKHSKCGYSSGTEPTRSLIAREFFIRPDLDSLTTYKEQVSVREIVVPKELKELSNLQNQ